VAPLAGIRAETIMTRPYPASDPSQIDPAAVSDLEWVMQFIMGIRRIRAEMDIAPSRSLPVLLANACIDDRKRLAANRHYLDFLARLECVTVLETDEAAPESATALVGEMQILIPMAGLIDKDAELARLDKEIGRLEGDIRRTTGKLGNASFVEKAPPAVVEKERGKLAEAESALENLQAQREKIQHL